MKTWDVLDRETGERSRILALLVPGAESPPLYDDEVAYCRETGEVVYR